MEGNEISVLRFNIFLMRFENTLKKISKTTEKHAKRKSSTFSPQIIQFIKTENRERQREETRRQQRKTAPSIVSQR